MRKNTRYQMLFFFKSSFFLFLILFFGQNCQNKPREVLLTFYHWKTTADVSALKSIKKEKIYVRLFDVDWDETAHFPKPLAELQNIKPFLSFKKITPVVFLTNKTFAQIIDYQVDTLALRVFEKIQKYIAVETPFKASAEQENAFDEIQFDCDWTATTRERYFSFLKKMKSLFPNKKISSTIRLHQVKFMDKTGIPPVDQGMLMAYNMGDLDNVESENSILSIKILKTYLKNFDKYPLKLDIALPIFSWGVIFRDGEAVKIINNLSKNELLPSPQYPEHLELFQQKSDNRFVLLKNQYFKGLYLYENDEIRIEEAPLSNLRSAAQFLSQNIKNQQLTVAFYHLDSAILQQYRYEDLENIIHEFE